MNAMHKLKNKILDKAKIRKGTQADNIKLGNMGSWAMLFGDCEWTIPELDGIKVRGTCTGYCKGCFDPEHPEKSPCYVAKSYVKYTNRNEDETVGNILTNECKVKLGHAYRTLGMTMFRDELLIRLDYQLMRMKNKFKVIRINESGEVTCYKDLAMWCELARRHMETVFYIYTKNYAAVRKAIANGIIPKNLFINISVWHEYGIEEYKEFASHPQIRAFVLVDDEFKAIRYNELGIDVEFMCPAYDSNGKMNHEVTCDKCKVCYSYRNKVTGCYEH